jgi:ppGpp synthetase/RelA/SpoT-type nucleotidyltranferase
MGYRRKNPKALRIIFSREPKIKTLDSITQKITDRRKENPSFKFEDLTDLVALTALCSYASDIPPFLDWLRKVFAVTPVNDQEALREYESGHRAYHFALRITDGEAETYSQLSDLQCELQVKTIVQEAFDAKSHDLAYKPGNLEVGKELKDQFAILSSALNSVDRQSEFLKDLIVREQQDLDLRRAACLELYFQDYGEIPSQVGLDPGKLPSNTIEVLNLLKKKAPKPLTKEFCKFSVYCALKLESDLLKNRTVEWVNQFVEEDTMDPARLGVRGSIEWALGYYEEAFSDMERIILWTGSTAPDADRIRRAKNNLVYYICDCKLFKHEVPAQWVKKARDYVKQIRKGHGTEADTVGLFEILWGETSEQIESGRRKLRVAKKARAKSTDGRVYEAFYNLHEHIALLRLLKLSKLRSHNIRKSQ